MCLTRSRSISLSGGRLRAWVTVQGDSFPSRVGASLARAVEMEDMIAYNLTEYEDKAVELGLNEQKRLEVRQRLARKRLEAPLFDTARWVTSFEESLETIWQRHQDHLPPRDIFPTDPGIMHSVRACDPHSRKKWKEEKGDAFCAERQVRLRGACACLLVLLARCHAPETHCSAAGR